MCSAASGLRAYAGRRFITRQPTAQGHIRFMNLFNEANTSDSLIYYGGSFNPPHIAHVLMVSALHAYFPLARIWVAPTYQHAFNKSLMPYDLRLKMLENAIGHIENVTISTIERDLHEATSYTIDVVREILRREPHTKIWITVGSDILESLHKWRNYEELCELAHFMVFPRQGYDNTHALPIPMLPEVSSSQIRERISQGKDIHGLVPHAVCEMLDAYHADNEIEPDNHK